MPSWLRKTLAWTLSLVAIICLSGRFGFQTILAIKFRREAKQIPLLNSVPGPLQNREVSQASGETISFRGAQFEAPWTGLIEAKSRAVGITTSAYFNSGPGLLLSVEPQNGLIQSLEHDDTFKNLPHTVAAFAGPDAMTSDYAFDKAVFETTPSQITPFLGSRRAYALTLVLITKTSMPPTSDYAIFNIQSDHFHGFQLGDPEHHPRKLCLELFSSDMHVEIVFFQPQQNGASFVTQAELNRIIQTLTEIPTKDATLTAKPL
jgi:hypothetical protein